MRLNLLEVVMGLRRSVAVPLAAVVDHPLSDPSAMGDVRLGFAAAGAPLAKVATVLPKAKLGDGRALVVVWRNQRSIVVDLAPNATRWRRLVVSVKNSDGVADDLRHRMKNTD